MEKKHPKRRKDKYNPYSIWENEGKYYLMFIDGQNEVQEFQIERSLYDIFNVFELEDLVYLNVIDRHIEQSELWEATLNQRMMETEESLETTVIRRIYVKELHKAMDKLPKVQERRLRLYFFEKLTYEQIARKERCSKVAIKYTIDIALKNLKKSLESILNF